MEPKPDANFVGTKNVVTFGVATGEALAINASCDPQQFANVFEVPDSLVRADKYRTLLSIDIADKAGSPIVTPGAKILQKAELDSYLPRVLVTLFETGAL